MKVAGSGLEPMAAAGVCLSQVLFLATGYAHQLYSAEISLDNIHVSGMLDDDQRSVLCGWLSLLSGVALVALELSRSIALLPLRLTLAAACTLGILLTCHIRESHNYTLHALSACIAFGSGIVLVWVVLYVRGSRGWVRFRAPAPVSIPQVQE